MMTGPSVLARWLATIMLAVWISGCSYVEVERADESRESYWRVGPVSIERPEAAQARLVQVTGLGVMSTPDGVTIGYLDSDFAFLDDSCRLVIWVENEAQLQTAKILLGQADDLCVLNQE